MSRQVVVLELRNRYLESQVSDLEAQQQSLTEEKEKDRLLGRDEVESLRKQQKAHSKLLECEIKRVGELEKALETALIDRQAYRKHGKVLLMDNEQLRAACYELGERRKG